MKVKEVRGGRPIKMWTGDMPVEMGAMEQLENVAKLPFIFNHVAVMPDVHWGIGATVGSVIATQGAVVPAAVGVDIGCGMMAVKTSLTSLQLPDNLHNLRLEIEGLVPHGRDSNGGRGDKGAFSSETIPSEHVAVWDARLAQRYGEITSKHQGAASFNNMQHLGTLGTGNHFIEICVDQNDYVWAMLHSGSRGAGNRIGTYFIEKAKREMERYFIGNYLPDKNLAYLVERTSLFNDYIEAVSWAQDFAQINRELMMKQVLFAMTKHLGPFVSDAVAINCHHNYVARESHFGKNVIVTRKGAVRARTDDLGIIPGSMGTGSFIVRGKGNRDSFMSCSHGAGRKMSRTQAKSLITLEDHAKAMKGIEARLDAEVLDESPAAYKDIKSVMECQADLVEIVHTLHQVLNVKG